MTLNKYLLSDKLPLFCPFTKKKKKQLKNTDNKEKCSFRRIQKFLRVQFILIFGKKMKVEGLCRVLRRFKTFTAKL